MATRHEYESQEGKHPPASETPDGDIVLMNQENFSVRGKRVSSYFEVSEELAQSIAQHRCSSAERSLLERCSREWGTFSITHLPSSSDVKI